MIRSLKRLFRNLYGFIDDSDRFLEVIDRVIKLVAKLLAIGMVLVTLVAVVELGYVLVLDLLDSNKSFFTSDLLVVFGLFLNVLIAIEILENITAYLKKDTIQLELIVATSLTAVARKLVIFDSKTGGSDLTGLALAILTLSISYWIIRRVNSPSKT